MTVEKNTSKPIEVIDDETSTGTGFGNRVILFNDSVHTFDEVTSQIMLAVGASEKEAFRLAYIVDSRGSAIVYIGEMEDCIKVSDILGAIGLETRITM